jgi:hypothetical protein
MCAVLSETVINVLYPECRASPCLVKQLAYRYRADALLFLYLVCRVFGAVKQRLRSSSPKGDSGGGAGGATSLDSKEIVRYRIEEVFVYGRKLSGKGADCK